MYLNAFSGVLEITNRVISIASWTAGEVEVTKADSAHAVILKDGLAIGPASVLTIDDGTFVTLVDGTVTNGGKIFNDGTLNTGGATLTNADNSYYVVASLYKVYDGEVKVKNITTVKFGNDPVTENDENGYTFEWTSDAVTTGIYGMHLIGQGTRSAYDLTIPYEIKKITPVFTQSPVGKVGLYWTGSAQQLIQTAAASDNGTVKYYVSNVSTYDYDDLEVRKASFTITDAATIHTHTPLKYKLAYSKGKKPQMEKK